MRRLAINNVGPVKSIDIQLNQVDVFIGPQGSGKSTIAKIISFCSWLEKINDVTEIAVAEGLVDRLGEFHHLKEYFSAESSILYTGENVAFAYNWKGVIPPGPGFEERNVELFHENEMVFYAKDKVVNPKVLYIPAERNFVSAVPSLRKYSERNDNLQSFVNDWFEAKRHYSSDSPVRIDMIDADYYYNQNKDEDYVSLGEKKIPLTSASSGFQSVVPLAVLVKWLSTGIYKENKPFSPEENQRIRDILAHLSGDFGDGEALLVDRLKGFIMGRVYTHTQFIIEEPEQNLFPKTQMDLLYYLLSEINHGKNHKMVLTTHSPYLLYSLNNCVLAYLVKDKVDEMGKPLNVECLPYAFDPKNLSVWSVRDGYLVNGEGERNKTLQDSRGLIRKNYFNDVMQQVMKDFNALLEYDD